MKKPYGESLANYADLESCAGDGDIAGEALTEALAGRLSSREIPLFGCRPCGLKGKAISIVALSQAAAEPGAVAEPVHVRKLPDDRETSATPAAKWQAGGGRRQPHAPRLRRRGVGAGGGTDERFERGRHAGGGESGGKQPRAEENVQGPRTGRAQQRAAVSQGLEGVRQAARRKATGRFTSLLHHLTPQLLRGIGSCGTRLRRRVQPPDAESRTSGGVGGCRGAMPGTRPDRKGRHVSYVRGRLPQATPGKRSGFIRL